MWLRTAGVGDAAGVGDGSVGDVAQVSELLRSGRREGIENIAKCLHSP